MAGVAGGCGPGPPGPVGHGLNGPPEVIRPQDWARDKHLPALGLIPPGSFNEETVLNLKQAAGVPVHLVFPLGSARGANNLRSLLRLLQPFRLPVDQFWIAYWGQRPESLSRLTEAFPQVNVFPVVRCLPADQQHAPLGKGRPCGPFCITWW
jgi:hypothetical protein